MKLRIAAALLSVILMATAARAQTVISQWTFEVNTPPDLTDSAMGPTVAADTGNGSATGLHASALTDWTTPVGNGSANSFSSNNWAVGDYYQFSLSTVGLSNIWVTFSSISSSTGPRDFSLQYSLTGVGGTFTSFASYVNAAPTWSATTYNPASQQQFDLSLVAGLNNNPDVVFRLVDTSTISVGGGTVGTAGSSRVDDFYVSFGGPIVVPEPATYMLLGFGVLVCAQQFRRKKG